MKERLDGQQVHEVGFMFDRIVETLEGKIEIFHSECGESLCQGCDVLPGGELMESLDSFFGSRAAASLGMGCGKQADIQRRNRRGQRLYYRFVSLLSDMQESCIQSRFRIVAIQLERPPDLLSGRLVVSF